MYTIKYNIYCAVLIDEMANGYGEILCGQCNGAHRRNTNGRVDEINKTRVHRSLVHTLAHLQSAYERGRGENSYCSQQCLITTKAHLMNGTRALWRRPDDRAWTRGVQQLGCVLRVGRLTRPEGVLEKRKSPNRRLHGTSRATDGRRAGETMRTTDRRAFGFPRHDENAVGGGYGLRRIVARVVFAVVGGG